MANSEILQWFFARADAQPGAVACYHKVDGTWQAVEWQQRADEVRRAARALAALGVAAGSRVALVTDSRPEWVIMYLAAWCLDAVPVLVYPGHPDAVLRAILREAEVEVALLERPSLVAGPLDGSRLRHIVSVHPGDDDDRDGGPPLVDWPGFLQRADAVAELQESAGPEADREPDPDALACVVYTPGTAGPPRPVPRSHGNLAWCARALAENLSISDTDWGLSYLSLTHPLERALSVHIPALVGSLVYHADASCDVAAELRVVQPSVFFAVPRVWRTMHHAVAARLARMTGWQASMLDWSRRVCRVRQSALARGQKTGLGNRLSFRLARYLAISKLGRALGLSNARLCLSAAAPLPAATLDFFASLDVPVYELYGQTATGYATSGNCPGAAWPGTAGRALAELRIEPTSLQSASDAEHRHDSESAPKVGEILARGPGVSAALADDDGWLRSGDIGRLEGDECVTVFGRRDHCFPGADGPPIGAAAVEHTLERYALIERAAVVADTEGRPHALLRLDPRRRDALLAERGLESGTPEAERATAQALDEIASEMTREELGVTVSSWSLLRAPLSVEGGQLTPALTPRRDVLKARHLGTGDEPPEGRDS